MIFRWRARRSIPAASRAPCAWPRPIGRGSRRIVYANTRQDAAEIGFDDSLIYDEIPKPVSERLIPMDHQPSLEARAVFDAWADKPDKITY